mmetsp:Transcript_4967/g.8738  ORF Transcript_4967/g.8738 Transcript_4967/m.8738 type:complete len:111 (-) Transcript_4967:393-725(-)
MSIHLPRKIQSNRRNLIPRQTRLISMINKRMHEMKKKTYTSAQPSERFTDKSPIMKKGNKTHKQIKPKACTIYFGCDKERTARSRSNPSLSLPVSTSLLSSSSLESSPSS